VLAPKEALGIFFFGVAATSLMSFSINKGLYLSKKCFESLVIY
jgi:hypothetical protein